MHNYVDLTEFYEDIAGFLAGYYFALALLNVGAAVCVGRTRRATARRIAAAVWWVVSLVYVGLGLIALVGSPSAVQRISLPVWAKDVVNVVTQPTWYVLSTFAALGLLFLARRFFVKSSVVWIALNGALLFLGLSVTDPDFARIVGRPDNVPIVGMVFLLGFFTWLATHRAVQNDDRIARGEPTLEQAESQGDKVLVWPDLVYIELICMVAVTAALIFWSIALKAPLEEPANPACTPNPSKAPWYFLGLQEMLLYFDAWMAGVVLPALIIFGLMAIPYLDVNKAGSGYYTIRQRPFAYAVYQIGFLGLWVTLILIGTFIRGPGWNDFGLYETWDPHKQANLVNVSLSERFWCQMLDRRLPAAPAESGSLAQLGYILLRELPGLALLGMYFCLLPPALAAGTRFFRTLRQSMGRMRYGIMMFLLLVMILLPIKMIARWTANLSYIVTIPEYFLNL